MHCNSTQLNLVTLMLTLSTALFVRYTSNTTSMSAKYTVNPIGRLSNAYSDVLGCSLLCSVEACSVRRRRRRLRSRRRRRRSWKMDHGIWIIDHGHWIMEYGSWNTGSWNMDH